MRLVVQPGSLGTRLLALAMLMALPLAAAHAEDPVGELTEAEQAVLDDYLSIERRTVAVIGARLSYPQRVSASLGAMFVRQPADYDCRTVCDFRGPLIQLEPGMDSLQLAVGYGMLVGERKDNSFALSDVYVGRGLKGVLLRTWEGSPLSPETQTLVGVEGEFTVTRVNFSLGVLRSLSGSDPDRRWVATGGIGWGF